LGDLLFLALDVAPKEKRRTNRSTARNRAGEVTYQTADPCSRQRRGHLWGSLPRAFTQKRQKVTDTLDVFKPCGSLHAPGFGDLLHTGSALHAPAKSLKKVDAETFTCTPCSSTESAVCACPPNINPTPKSRAVGEIKLLPEAFGVALAEGFLLLTYVVLNPSGFGRRWCFPANTDAIDLPA
jgi:hypothetical protein